MTTLDTIVYWLMLVVYKWTDFYRLESAEDVVQWLELREEHRTQMPDQEKSYPIPAQISGKLG